MAVLFEGKKSREVEAGLEKVAWPEFVVGKKYVIGEDSTGDKAVWVWLVLKDKGWTLKQGLALKSNILDALSEQQAPFVPYVFFRTQSEQRALDRKALAK